MDIDKAYAAHVKKLQKQALKNAQAAAPESKQPESSSVWQDRKNDFVTSMVPRSLKEATKLSASDLADLSKR